MAAIVGVRFKRAGKVEYYDPAGLELAPGDQVVVETERGRELGSVVIAPQQVVESEAPEPLRPVVRKATPEDLQQVKENKEQAKAALELAKGAAADLALPMKFLAGQYTLDRGRITLFFTAEERVDFRELVRDLAGRLRARIELHQIGPREETKATGGIGRCGRALCCASWMPGFSPVTVRMAKDQGLPVNQAQLAGVCGRLRCCLRYEAEGYANLQQRTPRVGDQVVTPRGVATVLSRSLLAEKLTLRLPDEDIVEMTLDEVRSPVAGGAGVPAWPGGCGRACGCAVRARGPRPVVARSP